MRLETTCELILANYIVCLYLSSKPEGGVVFHNILVAVDGSPDAELALTEAIDLAESERTCLTLFTAVSQPPATAYLAAGEEVGRLLEDAHAEAETILQRARDRVPGD